MKTQQGRMEAFDALLDALTAWPPASDRLAEGAPPHRRRRQEQESRPPIPPPPSDAGNPRSHAVGVG